MEFKLKIEKLKFYRKSTEYKRPKAIEKVIQKQKNLVLLAEEEYDRRCDNYLNNKKDLLLDAKDDEFYNKWKNYQIDLKNNLFLLRESYKANKKISDLNISFFKKVFNSPIEEKYPLYR
jgi:predicted nuclease of restriction endonuclease-like RecB superfamily